MSKKLLLSAIMVITGIFFSACSSEKKDVSGFGQVDELFADSIAIHEILQPRGWLTTGDKAVILSKGQDSVGYAYRLPDFKFLYVGLRVGGGPEELANPWPDPIQEYHPNGRFLLFHFGQRLAYYFTATDTGFVAGSAKRVGYGRAEGKPTLDSLVLDVSESDFRDDGAVYLFLYDIAQGGAVDSVRSQTYYLPDKQKYKNWSIFAQNGTVCVAVYSDTGRIEYYDVSSGKLILKKVVGDDTPVEELKNKIFSNDGPFYDYVATDGKYLYILETHYKNERRSNCDVLVYDWKGNPIKKYRLDKIIDNIIAGKGKLYGYNEKKDFEQVYVFDLGL